MAYGDLKVRNLIWNTGSGDNTVVLSTLATTSSPTFTGTVTVPTATAGDNSTKAASTAFVVASFATKANPTFTGTVTVPTASANDNTTKAASTAYVQTELGDYLTTATATSTYAPKNAPAFTGSATGVNLTLSGDLTVNGTTTTINTTTLQVEDKNIEIGKVASPSDTTADGGGWSLLGSTTKTFNWVNATDAWTSSEHIALGDNKRLQLGNSGDLYLYFNGTNSYLDTYGGDTYIRASASGSGGEENQIIAKTGGAVELYHNNVKKIETISGGINVTGAINVNGSPLQTAPTLTAVADGAITANKPIALTSAGKFTLVAEVKTAKNLVSTSGQSPGTVESGSFDEPACAFNPDTASQSGSVTNTHGLTLVAYQSGNTIYARACFTNSTYISDIGQTTTTIITNADSDSYTECAYVGDNYWLVVWSKGNSSALEGRTVHFTGSGLALGVVTNISSNSAAAKYSRTVKITNTRAVVFFRQSSNEGSNQNNIMATVIDFTNSGTSRTWSRGTDVGFHGSAHNQAHPQACYTGSRIVACATTLTSGDGSLKVRAGTISGAAGSGTITFGSTLTISNTANNAAIAYDSLNDKIAVKWKEGTYNATAHVYAVVVTLDTSDNSLTQGTQSDSGQDQERSDDLGDMMCSEIGYFIPTFTNGGRQRFKGFTVSGTTITWKNYDQVTNATSISHPRCTYDSINQRFVGVCETSGDIKGGMDTIHEVSSTGTAANFLGFSAGAYSDGDTATVNTFGNTATLSGLTTGSLHYLQNDGTINTTSGGAVCSVGTALSSTSLFIRDPA